MPFVSDVAWIPRVLRLVQTTIPPSKFTADHLLTNGFGPEAPQLVRFLRAVGFLDDLRHPTAAWTMYEMSEAGNRILHQLLRKAYAPLYETFLEPQLHDMRILESLVERATGYPERTSRQTVASYLSLCAVAHLEMPAEEERLEHDGFIAGRSYVVIQEMSDLLSTATFELEAAHVCFDAGALRPAHVSAWNGYVALALMRLAVDDFAAVRAVRPRWRGRTVADLALQTPGRKLIDLLVEADLLSVSDEVDVARLMRLRDAAAHPTAFRPSRHDTERYLDSVLTWSERLRQLTLA
ncbi:DUF5343 domain-containing protein [Aeromicrobium sp. A1-2]|uniref:DUF5343 domain-containing protein n=1 Tax=Aeromicrobium sp. A1-2 TaxID=2107713 RepID=UPI0013C34E09|nr:DUF5343 domain-containing protein [Aeromicrobium sp. A1-2]